MRGLPERARDHAVLALRNYPRPSLIERKELGANNAFDEK